MLYSLKRYPELVENKKCVEEMLYPVHLSILNHSYHGHCF